MYRGSGGRKFQNESTVSTRGKGATEFGSKLMRVNGYRCVPRRLRDPACITCSGEDRRLVTEDRQINSTESVEVGSFAKAQTQGLRGSLNAVLKRSFGARTFMLDLAASSNLLNEVT